MLTMKNRFSWYTFYISIHSHRIQIRMTTEVLLHFHCIQSYSHRILTCKAESLDRELSLSYIVRFSLKKLQNKTRQKEKKKWKINAIVFKSYY